MYFIQPFELDLFNLCLYNFILFFRCQLEFDVCPISFFCIINCNILYHHFPTSKREFSNRTVKTSSGRKWGTGYTEATSPYYVPGTFENIEARTYWGK